ncbi:acetyl-CoA C-acyltransferase [Emcibacter sp.]|uniref:acetyl-CoA C-acyltransferase n=1 Tax=Emcibacter sp. TaxID=1979954 RepID=UPI002AA6D6C3|nr:acetyl-CoA C-acyltransferase [Emcibacter sp.]
MRNAFLVDYARSAFSRAHPVKMDVDPFADMRADEILADIMKNICQRNDITNDLIDDLTIGCALPVKDQWSFGGRYPIYLSGLGGKGGSRMIDQQCGSGLAAMRMAALNIGAGSAHIALAAGYEHMTRIPMGPSLFKEGVLTVPSKGYDGERKLDMGVALNMGLTAERLAAESGIGRQAMDEFAYHSHQKAGQAQKVGFFANEIIPITTPNGQTVQVDGNIRQDTTLSRLAELKPVFDEEGIVSAGNSSPLTTGAALSVLMSEEAILKTRAEPVARIVSCVDRGVNPELMGAGVMPAIEAALENAGITSDQVSAWEINEAFSVVPLYAMKQLKLDPEKVNIMGGAIALGHPLGATGIRLTGTLARILRKIDGRYGVAAACIGGGQGIAMVIEKV